MLKIIVPSLRKLQALEYESCRLRKYVRSPFSKQSENKCNSAFSTIHSNIWGPRLITSFDFRYFVTLIDELSHCTRVYLM